MLHTHELLSPALEEKLLLPASQTPLLDLRTTGAVEMAQLVAAAVDEQRKAGKGTAACTTAGIAARRAREAGASPRAAMQAARRAAASYTPPSV